MNNQYMLALDQGTTSSRAIIFDRSGTPVATAQKEFKQIFPQPGWVEHNAEEIWSSQIGVMAEVLAQAGLDPQQIAGIGITNQRETAVLWNRKSGKPVCPAIVWQDRRTADFCDELKAAGHAGSIRQKTGLVIDSYFSASKLKWMLENVPGAREQAEKGELAFGTIDSWLIWKLTAGRLHITDVTNACRTQLMNIHTGAWDDDLLKLFSIPASVLPEIRSSSEIYGHTELLGPRHPIPIAGIAGDQQAALFGQICTQPGMVKNTYGTGCFMLMHTGEQAVDSKNNLLTTIAWKIGNRTEYALEGSIFIAGAVVQWLRDELRFFRNSSEIESLAASVSDTGGVYLVPAFAGLGAPHWNPHARGAVFGITRGTSKAHIARAALESIAFQTADIVHAMESDSGIPIRELRVDGGATVNNLLMQFQCDLLGVPVIRPKVYETTALGACYLAGLATGYWSSMDEIRKQWETDKRFEPAAPPQEVEKLRKGWRRAVKATMAWADDR